MYDFNPAGDVCMIVELQIPKSWILTSRFVLHVNILCIALQFFTTAKSNIEICPQIIMAYSSDVKTNYKLTSNFV